MKKLKTQSGNAFIYILVAIALFAALAYTFTRSGQQGGSGSISKQEAALAAAEIISYAQIIEEAVRRVRTKNRCSENEINFDTSALTGYTNGDAPGDNRCDIFHQSGGKVLYTAPNQIALDSALSSEDHYGEWFFTGANKVIGVGSDTDQGGNDLVSILMYVSLPVCIEINQNLGIENPGGAPPDEGTDLLLTKFAGAFASSPQELWDANTGTTSACLRSGGAIPDAGTYFYFHTNLIR